MSGTQGQQSLRELIEREHASIDRIVLEILAELDWLGKRPRTVGEPWDLPLIVASLRDHLERHFALEERGGPLDQALHTSPAFRAEVEQLVQEHRRFSARLERLLVEMDSGFIPPRRVQECFDLELRQVIADLREHEGTEFLLFARAFGAP